MGQEVGRSRSEHGKARPFLEKTRVLSQYWPTEQLCLKSVSLALSRAEILLCEHGGLNHDKIKESLTWLKLKPGGVINDSEDDEDVDEHLFYRVTYFNICTCCVYSVILSEDYTFFELSTPYTCSVQVYIKDRV